MTQKTTKYIRVGIFSLVCLIGVSVGIWGLLFHSTDVYENKNSLTRNVTKERSENEVKLIFVGDIMLSREIGRIMERENDWSYPFRIIKPSIEQADFLFGNLESPISKRGVKSGSIYSFRADPRTVEGLQYAGFSAVSLANNHIWDYGAEALTDTLLHLSNAGIGFSGAGKDYEESHSPFITRTKGLVIATLSYTDLLPPFLGRVNAKPAVSFFTLETAVQEVMEIRKNVDIVVVSLHWGEEYEIESNTGQKQIARVLIDAGADLIIGHHPHVIQEVEKYKNGYIAYSLGNFIFDQNFSEDTGKGLILTVLLKRGVINSVKSQEVFFNETYQPAIVPTPLPPVF